MNSVTPITTRAVGRAPAGWKWRSLTEVARLESGHTPSRRIPAYWDGGDIPWLSLKDIRGLTGKYVVDTADKPTALGIQHSSARVLPRGTVALCRTASVGKVAILGTEMATSQDFVNWVCSDQVLPEYLYWAFRGSEETFDVEKQGSTHQTIYMPTVARFQVLLPPVAEQRRIANVLDKADALRAKRRAALVQLDTLTQSIFLDMFGDPVANPRGWAYRSLQSLLAKPLRNGLSPSKSGRVEAKVLTLSAITGNAFNSTSIKTSTFLSLPPEAQSVCENDLLICRGNGNMSLVGKGYFPPQSMPNVTFPDTVIAATIHQDLVDRKFIEHVWNSALVRRQIESSARTTNGTLKVNQTALERTTVLYPPIESQRDFGKIVARVDSMRGGQARGARAADALFASLQQRAFSGDL